MSRPFPTSPLWPIIDWLGDKTAIPEKWVVPLIDLQWGWGSYDWPNILNLRAYVQQDLPSLFRNGLLYISVKLPFWVGVRMKLTRTHSFTTGIGWKGNGRFAVLLRLQTDESSAEGMDGPNYGQATGFLDGNA